MGCDLREPRTRDHDRRGGHEAFPEAVQRRLVGGVAHAGVVSVEDQDLLVGAVPETFGERLGPGGQQEKECGEASALRKPAAKSAEKTGGRASGGFQEGALRNALERCRNFLDSSFAINVVDS